MEKEIHIQCLAKNESLHIEETHALCESCRGYWVIQGEVYCKSCRSELNSYNWARFIELYGGQ